MHIYLQPFDDVIKNSFISAIVGGRLISEDERLLLSLTVKLRGLAIPIFNRQAPIEYDNSRKLSSQQVNNIKNQVSEYNVDTNQLNFVR